MKGDPPGRLSVVVVTDVIEEGQEKQEEQKRHWLITARPQIKATPLLGHWAYRAALTCLNFEEFSDRGLNITLRIPAKLSPSDDQAEVMPHLRTISHPGAMPSWTLLGYAVTRVGHVLIPHRACWHGWVARGEIPPEIAHACESAPLDTLEATTAHESPEVLALRVWPAAQELAQRQGREVTPLGIAIMTGLRPLEVELGISMLVEIKALTLDSERKQPPGFNECRLFEYDGPSPGEVPYVSSRIAKLIEHLDEVGGKYRDCAIAIRAESETAPADSRSSDATSEQHRDQVAENAFCCKGDYWEIWFRGKSLGMFKESHGVGYRFLKILVENPGRSFRGVGLWLATCVPPKKGNREEPGLQPASGYRRQEKKYSEEDIQAVEKALKELETKCGQSTNVRGIKRLKEEIRMVRQYLLSMRGGSECEPTDDLAPRIKKDIQRALGKIRTRSAELCRHLEDNLHPRTNQFQYMRDSGVVWDTLA
ncbi:MAG: hypothetical protein HYY93_09340 [Planctomycetes bacterium]|nr:hypothetical protein [Planctomycetota bacterium]